MLSRDTNILNKKKDSFQSTISKHLNQAADQL
jgi:hypothetical protein